MSFHRIVSRAVCTLAMAAAPFCSQPLLAEAPKPPCCRELQSSAPFTDRSIYQLESQWTSDVGRNVQLRVLRGHLQVVALFFTTCESSCPIIVDDMKSIAAALPDSLRDQVDFLLVSFDSERDTPAVLHAYREKMHLSPDHWTLLRGSPDDVRELAALLGVNYQKDARGQFMHSNLITVLNAEGEVVSQQTGLRGDKQRTLDALALASRTGH
jgi:protein SCO1/2